MKVPENIKGHSITIGRDPGDVKKLRITLDNNKSAVVPLPASDNVSRRHLLVAVDANGHVTLQNIKAVRPTYVDGMQIDKKGYHDGSVVELGTDRVRLDIDGVLEYASKMLPQDMSIAHLEEVWADYEAAIDKIDNKNKWSNAILSLGGVLVAPRFLIMMSDNISSGVQTVLNILLVAGALISVYAFIMKATDHTKEKKRALQIKFEQDYVCPNPKCNQFFGNKRFTLLKQYKKCPYCHVEFKNE